jgi:hypothetical protein
MLLIYHLREVENIADNKVQAGKDYTYKLYVLSCTEKVQLKEERL